MGELLRWTQHVARPVALLWVGVLAPFELATALTSLLTRSARELAWTGVALVGGRVLAVAFGLLVARQLLQPDPETGAFARRWALVDLVTLALVLSTDALPSNRLPGTGWVVWTLYAAMDAVVLVAARRAPSL